MMSHFVDISLLLNSLLLLVIVVVVIVCVVRNCRRSASLATVCHTGYFETDPLTIQRRRI